MELHYHVLLPQKNFLDDFFYFFLGSVVAEKKKTERKTEGHSHWAKDSMRMPLFLARICRFWARERKGRRICFVLGKEPRRGRVRRSGAVGVVGGCLGREKVWSTEEGKTEKTATSATARERLFAAKRGYGMLFSCILLFFLFGGLTAA